MSIEDEIAVKLRNNNLATFPISKINCDDLDGICKRMGAEREIKGGKVHFKRRRSPPQPGPHGPARHTAI